MADEKRARDLGIVVGDLRPGPLNSITDVAGVRVGHVTLSDEGHADGSESIRTGVTAIVPATGNLFALKVPAASHVINGFGKAAGLSQINELGTLETPIILTNTLSVGAGMLGLVKYTLAENSDIRSVNAVVGECNDGLLNNIGALSVQPAHVLEAISCAADGPVVEGAVGAGTGMICYGWKGGIGTASRLVQIDARVFTVGVLLLSNFGHAKDLRIDGVLVGAELVPPTERPADEGQTGSCVVVVATSAPVDARQLGRLARRVQNGLARTGTFGEHGSGEFALAFSTARRIPHVSSRTEIASAEAFPEDGVGMNLLFQAVVEATEEAVLNSLFAARSIRGWKGRFVAALPPDRVMELLARG